MCREAGIPIAGGHTIDSVEAIYGLVALGLVHPKRVKRNAGREARRRAGAGQAAGRGRDVGGVEEGRARRRRLRADDRDHDHSSTRPGPELAALRGVHAMTDVTGFGLAGHALEMARGARCDVQLDWSTVPLLAGVRDLAGHGFVTGASGRNWAGYGQQRGPACWLRAAGPGAADRPANQRWPAGVLRAGRGAGRGAGDLPTAMASRRRPSSAASLARAPRRAW